ncbi:MAG: enoyl-CoA hydratase/isomerase family protein [Bacteroidetes bacterium]|nr:enoyl-CoA hydratase/isomerase family protein [Bacteroidota bacterium]
MVIWGFTGIMEIKENNSSYNLVWDPNPFSTLGYSIHTGIAVLVLNQPPSNTLSKLFLSEFRQVIESVETDNQVKALIITGKGRHFSSGSDLRELAAEIQMNGRGESSIPTSLADNNLLFLRLLHLNIPVIAAIKGVCLGSALELALFCHFRIVAEGAVMGLPESTFGLIPGAGGFSRMNELSGGATALEWILRGDNLTTAEAFTLGLIDQVVPKKELLPYAIDLAQRLPENFHPGSLPFYKAKYLNQDA